MGNLRYPVVVAVILSVLGLLFAGQWIYTKYVLERPVVDALDLPEVESTEFVEDTNTVIVKLKEVENLQETYLDIRTRLQNKKANRNTGDLKIVITDNRSPLLEEAFYQSQFAVHEAIMQGSFISMYDSIQGIASDYELDRYAVFIDSDRVYIEFHKDGHNLYEVISREIPGKNSLAPQDGSEEL